MELYHLELTTDERNELLMALGYWHGAMLKAGRPWFEHKLDVVNKICSLRPAGSSASASSGSEREATAAGLSPVAASTAPAAVITSDPARSRTPPEGRVGQIIDKIEKPRPAEVTQLRIVPASITKIGSGEKERLLVRWSVGPHENLTASCWASVKDIWPAVLDTVKRPTVFLIKESNGYINIVGVKDL